MTLDVILLTRVRIKLLETWSQKWLWRQRENFIHRLYIYNQQSKLKQFLQVFLSRNLIGHLYGGWQMFVSNINCDLQGGLSRRGLKINGKDIIWIASNQRLVVFMHYTIIEYCPPNMTITGGNSFIEQKVRPLLEFSSRARHHFNQCGVDLISAVHALLFILYCWNLASM